MKERDVFEVRVSKSSDPARVATSILIALSQDKDVIVSSVGDSIKVATKAVARLKQFNDTGKTIRLEVYPENVTNANLDGSYVVIYHKISLVKEIETKPVTIVTRDYNIEEIEYNAELIKETIEKKISAGYEYLNALPITEYGNTTKVHLIFRELKEK